MQGEIQDWLTLTIDTYEELKEETTTSTKPEEVNHDERRKTHTINTAGSNKLSNEGNPVDAILRASIMPGSRPDGDGLGGNHSNDLD